MSILFLVLVFQKENLPKESNLTILQNISVLTFIYFPTFWIEVLRVLIHERR